MLAVSSPAGDKVGRPSRLERGVKFWYAAVDFFDRFQFSVRVFLIILYLRHRIYHRSPSDCARQNTYIER